MNTRKFIYYACCIAVLTSSCQVEEIRNAVPEDKGQFVVSNFFDSNIELTKSYRLEHKGSSRSENMAMSVSECDWDSQTVTTKGNTLKDYYFWNDIPNVALYIGDSGTKEIKYSDMPFNPSSGKLFKWYYNPNDLIQEVSNDAGNSIGNSSFFWNNMDKKEDMPDFADFYGYYPRPCNTVNTQYELKYSPISIIERQQARNGNTTLSYSFQPIQHETTLSYFDIMCSIPEEESDKAYGNKMKSSQSNIQLRFKHMLCLFEVQVNRGNYQGECKITSLKLTGKQVHTTGELDILNCTIKSTNDNSEIQRYVKPYIIAEDSPFQTTMIVAPTDDNVDPKSGNADLTRLVLSCTIDGAIYSCSLPMMALESGKKYKLNLSLAPSEILELNVWDGATVHIGNTTFEKGTTLLTPKDIYEFQIDPESGMDYMVFRNCQLVKPVEGSNNMYKLEMTKGLKTSYNIVAYPQNNWYEVSDMRIQFDGKWNDKFHKDNPQEAITYWHDLSGHDNNGLLKSFIFKESGWMNNGLAFDGINDIVTFPGDISNGEYTLEFYINVASNQLEDKGNSIYHYKRLIGEPDDKTDRFPAVYITGGNGIGFYGQGVDTQIGNTTFVFDKIVQYDIVYDGKMTVELYVNGKSKGSIKITTPALKKEIASLGSRTQDNSRALRATYYSFIMYDKALTAEQISHNFTVNQTRFGTAE